MCISLINYVAIFNNYSSDLHVLYFMVERDLEERQTVVDCI